MSRPNNKPDPAMKHGHPECLLVCPCCLDWRPCDGWMVWRFHEPDHQSIGVSFEIWCGSECRMCGAAWLDSDEDASE